VWAKGKLWKVDAQSGAASNIPFSAQVEQTVADPLRFERKLDAGRFSPKMIRDVATSPDGKRVVFHALGHLWTKALPNGEPQRLTTNTGVYEYQPSFNARGDKLLYTVWSDADLVTLRERDFASGSERDVTSKKGFYYGARYSPDGSKIVYSRTGGGGLTGSLWSGEPGIYVMPAAGGDARRIAKSGEAPQFSADGKRVYFFTGGGLSKKLMSVGLNGEESREVFSLKYPDLVSISPDGKWVAFTELFNAYVAPLPHTGGVIELSKDTTAIPLTRVTRDSGSYLHWAADSRSLHWMVGDEYYSRELTDLFAFVPGAAKELPKPESARGVTLGLAATVDAPRDTVAFSGARIVTMRDSRHTQEVIEDGVIVVEGDTIRAVGERGEVVIPAGARQIDASGKTIVPGYVDAHAHVANFGGGVIPQANWAYYANLAFGVTTAHDPVRHDRIRLLAGGTGEERTDGRAAHVLHRHHPVRRRWRLQGRGRFARRRAHRTCVG
jgi:dipeptidyl aminopeptidase/acylaminoacyl peptidase